MPGWRRLCSSLAASQEHALRGPVPDASWDSALAPAVREAGVEVEEELVLDLLLGDLADDRDSRGRRPGSRATIRQ